jgi:DNA-binding NarL/FixJ family response regulator
MKRDSKQPGWRDAAPRAKKQAANLESCVNVPSRCLYLTPREAQIVRLLTKGLCDKKIADELHLSEGTVGQYLNAIFKRFGFSSRLALVVHVLENGPRGQHAARRQAPNER